MRRHALVYLGMALAIGTAVVIYCMFFIWVPVVLMQGGSRSEARFYTGIRQQGISITGMSALGTMEIKVRWFQAARAVALAQEIDPSGERIVCTYPYYPDIETMRWPRDPEKP